METMTTETEKGFETLMWIFMGVCMFVGICAILSVDKADDYFYD